MKVKFKMKGMFILSLLCIFLLSGFQQQEFAPSITGTWVLKYYVNAKTGDTLLKQEYLYSFNSSVEFTFYDHNDTGVVSGNTYENRLFGNYVLSNPDKIDISISGDNEKEPIPFSGNFRKCINSVYGYEVNKRWLKLYYNKGECYMLFRRKRPNS